MLQTDNPAKGFKNVIFLGRVESIPQHWSFEEIEKVGEVIGGGTPDTTVKEYWDGELPWAVPSDITDLQGNFIAQTERRITGKGLENSSAKILPVGTILITSRATIGENAINTVPMATNQGFQSLICYTNNDNLFMLYTIRFRRAKLIRLAYGTTFLEIPKSEIKRVKIPVPPLNEQQKIASILSKVDDLIQKTDETIEQMQRLKKGLMQSLFAKGIDEKGRIGSEEIRNFKDSPLGKIPEDWNVEQMKNICEKVSVGIATSTTKHFTEKGVPILRNQNIKEGYIETKDLLHITEAFSKVNYSKRLKEGDVLCVRTGVPGQSAVVTPEMEGWHTFTTLIIRPLRKVIYPNYLCWFLNSPKGKELIRSVQGGGVQHNLNAGWISSMWIPVPPVNEQQKIIDLISNNLKLVEKEQDILSELHKLKKGLMQKLLTGQIRVKV